MATLGGPRVVGGVGKNLMHNNGYVAKVEFDEEAQIFHGEIVNLRDVITFEGKSVSELQQAMRESIEDYLEFCKERGEEPEKPFSGQFIVRVDPELHRKVTLLAKEEDKSLNQLVTDILLQAVN